MRPSLSHFGPSLPRRGFLRIATTLVVGVALVGVSATPARAQVPPVPAPGSGIVIDTLNLTGIAYDAATGVLSATGGTVTGTLSGLPFSTDVSNFKVQLVP